MKKAPLPAGPFFVSEASRSYDHDRAHLPRQQRNGGGANLPGQTSFGLRKAHPFNAAQNNETPPRAGRPVSAMSKINEGRIAGQSDSRLSTPRLGRENIAQPSSSSKGGGSGQGQRDSMRHLCPHALLKKRYKKSGQPVTANRLFLLWCARRDSNSWPTGS